MMLKTYGKQTVELEAVYCGNPIIGGQYEAIAML